MKQTVFTGSSLRRFIRKFARRRKTNRPRRTTLACETLETRQLLTVLISTDFGDAPEPYPTEIRNAGDGAIHGASHWMDERFHLGEKVDAEPNGRPHEIARGDDNNNVNDEDGVRFTSALRVGETATLEVTASSNEGFLNAWLDFNADGDWDDPGEQIFTNRRLAAGINQLEIVVSADVNLVRRTFARFRYSTETDLGPTGSAQNGEVEDYAVAIAGPRGGPDQIGTSLSKWFMLDVNANGRWDGNGHGDAKRAFGLPTDTSLTGDWNGDGVDEIGVFRSSNLKFYLDFNGNRRWDGVGGGDVVQRLGGIPGDSPVVGDWNGDGYDEIGLHRKNKFLLDQNGNGRWEGVAGGDVVRVFGAWTDTPIIGDWNGDGTDDIGVHRHNKFFLDTNGNGRWDGPGDGGDTRYRFGNPGQTPLAGDWDGDGTDEIGTHGNNVFFVDYNADGRWNGRTGGDEFYKFRNAGETPLIGKWRLPLG